MHRINTTPKSEHVFVEQVFASVVKDNAALYRRFVESTWGFYRLA